MTLSEVRNSGSWQGAIELGPAFMQLAEELPAGEQMGLSLQLREGIVNLASGIALDLMEGGTFTRRRHAVRLMAALDLIDRVYPALDTATCRESLAKLVAQLDASNLDQAKATPQIAAPATAPAAPSPASSVTTPTDEPSTGLKIQVTPDGEVKAEDTQDDDVHPDSVQ